MQCQHHAPARTLHSRTCNMAAAKGCQRHTLQCCPVKGQRSAPRHSSRTQATYGCQLWHAKPCPSKQASFTTQSHTQGPPQRTRQQQHGRLHIHAAATEHVQPAQHGQSHSTLSSHIQVSQLICVVLFLSRSVSCSSMGQACLPQESLNLGSTAALLMSAQQRCLCLSIGKRLAGDAYTCSISALSGAGVADERTQRRIFARSQRSYGHCSRLALA